MITTAYANKLLSLMTAKTDTLVGTGYCYLGLSTTVPNADGSNFSEPDPSTYPSYSRIQLNVTEATKWTDIWGDAVDGAVSNAKEFTSAECKEEAGWPECVYFGIFDSATSKTPIAVDPLTDPDGQPDDEGKYPAKSLTVEYEHVAVFRIGTLRLQLK